MTTSNSGRGHVDAAGVIVSILALLVALASLVFAIFQHRENVRLVELIDLDPGELIVHRPTEFCIARGYQWFPSDHLIIPVVVENTGRGAKILERPVLFLEDNLTGEPLTYSMQGYLSRIDLDIFQQEVEVARGVAVPERSLSRIVLAFHIADWWNEQSPNFAYHFQQVDGLPDLLPVRLGYYEAGSDTPVYWEQDGNDTFFTLPLYGTINRLGLNPELVEYLEYHGLYEGLDYVDVSDYDADCFALAEFPPRP